ncbi:rho gtpase-activating protein 68f [Anaeramoeba flamelloides]|uniref:Rho gtpase-activating protein 68f n=1 Tax=Anaeramoeba flamelloides TaxID=1746091 RepID=A0ABQ8YS03_9EUKA|nr:rho gtpase-activating protein 68f [Anaeramoeba flamelloides]
MSQTKPSLKNSLVTSFLGDYMDFILEEIEEEELFTNDTPKEEMLKYQKAIENDDNLDLESIGVVKLSNFLVYYFSSLDEPLIPDEEAPKFKNITLTSLPKETQEPLQALPSENLNLLGTTIKFFYQLIQNSSITTKKLGMIFGPVFIRSKEDGLEKSCVKHIQALIGFYPQIERFFTLQIENLSDIVLSDMSSDEKPKKKKKKKKKKGKKKKGKKKKKKKLLLKKKKKKKRLLKKKKRAMRIRSNSTRVEVPDKNEIENGLKILQKRLTQMRSRYQNIHLRLQQESEELSKRLGEKKKKLNATKIQMGSLDVRGKKYDSERVTMKNEIQILESTFENKSEKTKEINSGLEKVEGILKQIEKVYQEQKDKFINENNSFESIIAGLEFDYDWQKQYINQLNQEREELTMRCKAIMNFIKNTPLEEIGKLIREKELKEKQSSSQKEKGLKEKQLQKRLQKEKLAKKRNDRLSKLNQQLLETRKELEITQKTTGECKTSYEQEQLKFIQILREFEEEQNQIQLIRNDNNEKLDLLKEELQRRRSLPSDKMLQKKVMEKKFLDTQKEIAMVRLKIEETKKKISEKN